MGNALTAGRFVGACHGVGMVVECCDIWSFEAAGYSNRTVDGAVILWSSGSVTVMTPKAITRPMPMIV